jgi:hypothetical protein
VLGGFSLAHAALAARSALEGKRALLRSEGLIGQQQLQPARLELQAARAKFDTTRKQMATATRFLPIARYVPILRSQILGVEALADAGLILSDAGIDLADAAAVIVENKDAAVSFSDSLGDLRTIRGLLANGLTSIDEASAAVDRLDGSFLPGPVGDARSQFNDRLPEIRERTADTAAAMAALISFVGGNGPRSYLFLSQNPDEVRPTGGFIGTYGVLKAVGGDLTLDRYDGTGDWGEPRPQPGVTAEEKGGPFRYDSRLPQGLANVNTEPDWPRAAQRAIRLWERGGEAPVDGVISFTPAFLARVLTITGPVTVEGYGAVVTSENLIERLEFYTHEQTPLPGTDSKDFIAVLAKTVMDRLIDVRTSQWSALGQVLGEAFTEREAMAWVSDPEVGAVLADRRWDGALPVVTGDFVYPAEFQYAAKNGRSLRRVYDHHVRLRPDGSGSVVTTVRVTNPNPPDDYANIPGTLAFVTMYGPAGATVGRGTDQPSLPEPAMADHPARSFFRPLEPRSESKFTVEWEVPQLVRQGPDGTWEYSLLFMRLPDHTGDVLELNVELPPGWRWAGDPPPNQVALDRDFSGRWAIER